MTTTWAEVTLHPVTENPRWRRFAKGDHFVNVEQATGHAGLYYQGMELGSFATRQIAEVRGENHIRAIAAFAADADWMSGWTEEPSDAWGGGSSTFVKDRVRIWRSNGNMLAYPGDPRVYLTSVVLVSHEEAERGNKLVREEGGMGRSCGRHETLEEAKAAAGVLPVAAWVAEAHVQFKVRARKPVTA